MATKQVRRRKAPAKTGAVSGMSAEPAPTQPPRNDPPVRRNAPAVRSNAAVDGTYYLLDMGGTKYGDCIVCDFKQQTILIDGGHRQDLDGQPGYRSIPDQLELILGRGPHHFDLLVVTHCHDDHIGCLPELVDQGIVTATWALVSDPEWGYGRAAGSGVADADFGIDDPDPQTRGLIAALTEEDYSDLADGPLQDLIDAVAKTEDRYNEMLQKLKSAGTKVIRHQRDPVPQEFLNQFASTGLQVLGPSREQLEACSAALARFVAAATRKVRSRRSSDAEVASTDLYREIVGTDSVDAADMAGTSGPPKNNQSIVLAFGAPGSRVLLGADMQFAVPELNSADTTVEALREQVKAAGPYLFVKALHHTSYNGQDEDTLQEWGPPRYMAHSGGLRDPNHPDNGALATLKKHKQDLQYARTDRNGIVQFSATKGFTIEKGRLNDFTTNTGANVSSGEGEDLASNAGQQAVAESNGSNSVLVLRLPQAGARLSIDGIEIEVEPFVRNVVSPSRDSGRPAARVVSPAAAPRPSPSRPSKPAVQSIRFAGGRTLDKLLFFTNRAGLEHNIGQAEAKACLDAVSASGNAIVDVPEGADRAALVKDAFAKHPDTKAAVILGGYDIVPSVRLDVLSSDLRQRLGDRTADDADNFTVWSDDAYGDRSGGNLPDVPVSRIPDARDAQLVMNALSAVPAANGDRFGIRNLNRPFANAIWDLIPGSSELQECGPYTSEKVRSEAVAQPFIYFMLHGKSSDGRVFLGEMSARASDAEQDAQALPDATFLDAFYATQVPDRVAATILAGCCWGALTVKDLASSTVVSGQGPTPRVPEASIALSFLRAGALAFVGCTGSHYSPDSTGSFAGGPMQRLFWGNVAARKMAPAAALFQAKIDFLSGMPHGRDDLFEMGIERKILREFTCLGLGW